MDVIYVDIMTGQVISQKEYEDEIAKRTNN